MGETPNTNNEAANGGDNVWASLAEEAKSEPVEETENAPDMKGSDQLKQELEDLNKRLKELMDQYGGIKEIPRDILHPLRDELDEKERAIEKAEIAEAKALLPESQREAFQEYADSESHFLTIDVIIEGIKRYASGESLDDIKDSILHEDWGGATDEINQLRGQVVFDDLIKFLGVGE